MSARRTQRLARAGAILLLAALGSGCADGGYGYGYGGGGDDFGVDYYEPYGGYYGGWGRGYRVGPMHDGGHRYPSIPSGGHVGGFGFHGGGGGFHGGGGGHR